MKEFIFICMAFFLIACSSTYQTVDPNFKHQSGAYLFIPGVSGNYTVSDSMGELYTLSPGWTHVETEKEFEGLKLQFGNREDPSLSVLYNYKSSVRMDIDKTGGATYTCIMNPALGDTMLIFDGVKRFGWVNFKGSTEIAQWFLKFEYPTEYEGMCRERKYSVSHVNSDPNVYTSFPIVVSADRDTVALIGDPEVKIGIKYHAFLKGLQTTDMRDDFFVFLTAVFKYGSLLNAKRSNEGLGR